MSTALTNGILVTVRSQYIPERSSVSGHQYAFAYTVKIANQGDVTARLFFPTGVLLATGLIKTSKRGGCAWT